jgi:hypothetical protein
MGEQLRTVRLVVGRRERPAVLQGDPHPEDVCRCGDYRRQHRNDGPSALNWDNPKGVEACMKFRLFRQATVKP